jgi:hypothetical protein
MALAKSVYAVPTWTRTVALVREHAAVRVAVAGVTHDVPPVYACYRFAVKLRTYGARRQRMTALPTSSFRSVAGGDSALFGGQRANQT